MILNNAHKKNTLEFRSTVKEITYGIGTFYTSLQVTFDDNIGANTTLPLVMTKQQSNKSDTLSLCPQWQIAGVEFNLGSDTAQQAISGMPLRAARKMASSSHKAVWQNSEPAGSEIRQESFLAKILMNKILRIYMDSYKSLFSILNYMERIHGFLKYCQNINDLVASHFLTLS